MSNGWPKNAMWMIEHGVGVHQFEWALWHVGAGAVRLETDLIGMFASFDEAKKRLKQIVADLKDHPKVVYYEADGTLISTSI